MVEPNTSSSVGSTSKQYGYPCPVSYFVFLRKGHSFFRLHVHVKQSHAPRLYTLLYEFGGSIPGKEIDGNADSFGKRLIRLK